MIVRGGRDKLQKIHNRILLAMSCIDIFNSSALGSSTAMIPKRYNNIIFYGAYGTDATCTIQAFFVTLGLAQPMYNSILCVYYLAVIKYNVSDDVLAKYEKYMHAFAILPPLTIAILGIAFDLYHPMWNDYCGFFDECTLQTVEPSLECTIKPHYFQMMVFIIYWGVLLFGFLGFFAIFISMSMIYISVRNQALKMRRYSSFQRRNLMNGGENNSGTRHETFIQSTMYVLAYVCTYTWPIVNSFVQPSKFHLLYLKAIFFPLQGFWNFITFIRPRFVVIQEKKKDKSFWWILKAVVSGYKLEEELAAARRNSLRQPSVSNNLNSSSRLDVIQRANAQKHERQRGTSNSAFPVASPGNNSSTFVPSNGNSTANKVGSTTTTADRGDNVTASEMEMGSIEEAKEEITAPDYSAGYYANNNTEPNQDVMHASNDEPENDETDDDKKQVKRDTSSLFADENETPTSHYGLETTSHGGTSQISDSSFAAQEIIENMIEGAKNQQD